MEQRVRRRRGYVGQRRLKCCWGGGVAAVAIGGGTTKVFPRLCWQLAKAGEVGVEVVVVEVDASVAGIVWLAGPAALRRAADEGCDAAGRNLSGP